MEVPTIESPRQLAEFLVEQTNSHEAPQGSVLVIDLDNHTHKITKIGFTVPNANPNEMIAHAYDSLEPHESRVLIVPNEWNTDSYIKDIMSVLSNDGKTLDVLTIDYDRQVWWSVLCSDPDCCPIDGQSVYQS